MNDILPPIKSESAKQMVIPAAHRPAKTILQLLLGALFIGLLGGGLFLVFQGSISVPKFSSVPLSSPKIISEPAANYVCPATEYLNCFQPTEQDCSVEYVKWAKTNCSGFKGVAASQTK